MHSAIFFISTLHWTYSIIVHMACIAYFLKGLLSSKKQKSITSKINSTCLFYMYNPNSNATLYPTVTYMQLIRNIRQKIKKKGINRYVLFTNI